MQLPGAVRRPLRPRRTDALGQSARRWPERGRDAAANRGREQAGRVK